MQRCSTCTSKHEECIKSHAIRVRGDTANVRGPERLASLGGSFAWLPGRLVALISTTLLCPYILWPLTLSVDSRPTFSPLCTRSLFDLRALNSFRLSTLIVLVLTMAAFSTPSDPFQAAMTYLLFACFSRLARLQVSPVDTPTSSSSAHPLSQPTNPAFSMPS